VLGAARSVASISGRRILAIRAGALGDTILALPSVAALRRIVGPSGEVDFVGREPAMRLALGPALASLVHSIDRPPFRALFQESMDDSESISFLKRFALVVAWANLPLLEEKLRKISIPLLRSDPRPPAGVHASDHLYAALSPLGVEGPAPPPEIALDSESRLRARDFLNRHGLSPGDFVALHPSSGSPGKNWPPERFLELAGRFSRERCALLWVEGEADREIVAALERGVAAPVARNLPLPVLASLLALSRGFVGNDSGVTHLAAAIGIPTIALFGPTDPATWAPRGPFVLVEPLASNVEAVWGKARSQFSAR
jgi:heptosyltransferase-3